MNHSTAPEPHPSTEEHDDTVEAHYASLGRPVRLYACAGCGRRLPRRELVELHEDNHDNLTYFHGDLLCPACADNAGVAR